MARSKMNDMDADEGFSRPFQTPMMGGDMMASKKGIGFKAAQQQIASKGGYSQKSAGAILANATRNASPAAKKANPNLKRVKG